MLSIGKLTAGREAYYLSGLAAADEYYLSPVEPPGVWHGQLAGALGLAGRVDPDAFKAVLDGHHPHGGGALVANAGADGRVTGLDLTFSAPKSVSVLWALADPATAQLVADAHDHAVADALGLLEAEAVHVRRGAGGHLRQPGEGLVAAAFAHRTSRAGDPQLHTHLVVANLTRADDGRWSAPDGRAVFGWAKTVGYAYQAALRHHLATTLGVTFGPVVKGAAEITGITPEARRRFSTRREQITASLDTLGLTSTGAARTASLATRPAKAHGEDFDSLRDGWASTVADLRLDPASLVGPGRTPQPPTVVPGMFGPTGLTANASSFDRRSVLQALYTAAGDGALPETARRAADTALARPEVVALGDDPSAMPATGRRYTTVELLAVEAHLLHTARTAPAAGLAAQADLDAALAARPTLTDEQQAMVSRLTRSGAGVEVVIGRAGTGKTFALDAARAAWTASGHTVVGAALAARAAAELQAGAGIPSTTVARLLADIDIAGPAGALPHRGVLVVDEAGMVGTRLLDRLVGHATRAGMKVVLVGDHRQLPEIDAGGALAALARAVPTTTLTTNRRQRHAWERDALDQLRHGPTPAAVLTTYAEHGRLRLAPTADTARQALVDDWWTTRRSEPDLTAAMYAVARTDVADLNRRARQLMRDAGRLAGPDVEVAGRPFAVGDQVLCLRNDRRLGVTNGTTATLTSITPDQATIALADGRQVELPGWYLDDGRLTHAYATTVHKAQGATVDRAFLLGTDQLYREAGYVGLSRARLATHLYAVDPRTPTRSLEPQPDPLAALGTALATSRAQTLASLQEPQIDVDGLLADPPAWAVDHLGPPPVAGTRRDRWADAALRAAAYRTDHGITDDTTLLGDPPADPTERRQFDLARAASRPLTQTLDLTHGLDR